MLAKTSDARGQYLQLQLLMVATVEIVSKYSFILISQATHSLSYNDPPTSRSTGLCSPTNFNQALNEPMLIKLHYITSHMYHGMYRLFYFSHFHRYLLFHQKYDYSSFIKFVNKTFFLEKTCLSNFYRHLLFSFDHLTYNYRYLRDYSKRREFLTQFAFRKWLKTLSRHDDDLHFEFQRSFDLNLFAN